MLVKKFLALRAANAKTAKYGLYTKYKGFYSNLDNWLITLPPSMSTWIMDAPWIGQVDTYVIMYVFLEGVVARSQGPRWVIIWIHDINCW